MPSPPARVVSKKINFSLPGLLYSSMAAIRSSWAVPPSMRQYSTRNPLSWCPHLGNKTHYIDGISNSLRECPKFGSSAWRWAPSSLSPSSTGATYQGWPSCPRCWLCARRWYKEAQVPSETNWHQLSQELMWVPVTYGSVKEIGVACYFTKLHDHIHQPSLPFLLACETWIHSKRHYASIR